MVYRPTFMAYDMSRFYWGWRWSSIYFGGTRTCTKTNRYQNVKFSKLKKFAILIPHPFDTPLSAAKEI